MHLHRSVVGDGSLVVVVPGGAWLEDDLADRLAAPDRTLVFYDQRNRGRSPRSDAISMDVEVDDLEAVRREVAGERPVVTLGWSYLGAVVALHAVRYPASVLGVVMVSPMAPRQGVAEYHVSDEVIDDYRRRWAEVQRRVEATDDRRERGRLTSAFRMARKDAIDRMRSEPWRFENEWEEHRDPVFARLFDGLEDRDWRVGCESVSAPVLLFHGTEDGPLAMATDWADSFGDCRLVALDGVGHFAHLEAAAVFDAEVDAFLRRTGAASPS